MTILRYKFLWVLVGIGVFIVGVAIYFLVHDETADWNVYRNDVYGFALKYPRDWEVWARVYGDDEGRHQVTPESTRIAFGSIGKPTANGDVEILVRRNQQPETVEGIIQGFQGGQGEKVTLGRLSFVGQFLNSDKKREDITIAAKLQNNWENELKEKWSSRLFYIPHGNITLVLSEIAQVESPTELKVVEQMAGTIELFELALVASWDKVCAFPEFRLFEIAVRQGEGPTHIARSVLKAYASAVVLHNPEEERGFYLLPEEKVYAEDYIVKRLNVSDIYYTGDIVKIPCTLVEEAAAKARQLTMSQRGTLEEFSQQVPQFEIIQQVRDVIEKTATSSGVTPFLLEGGR